MTQRHTNEVQAGQHSISYAYPSSSEAERLGHGKVGTYVVQTADAATTHPTYEAALGNATALGTTANRWSMDHPANARFLP